jgi:hypothetical protein
VKHSVTTSKQLLIFFASSSAGFLPPSPSIGSSSGGGSCGSCGRCQQPRLFSTEKWNSEQIQYTLIVYLKDGWLALAIFSCCK